MRGRPWTDVDMRQASKLYRSGVEISEIARQMGRRATFISDKLHENGGKRYGRWSEWDDLTLATEVESGATSQQIARKLGRTMYAVESRRKSLGLRKREVESLYSGERLAKVFFKWGVYTRVAMMWMERGMIRSRNGLATREAILDFLANPDWWMAWSPDQLRDRELREWVSELQASHPWKWLSVQDAADRLFVVRNTVNVWCNKGRFPSAKRYPNRLWWIRSDDEGLRV